MPSPARPDPPEEQIFDAYPEEIAKAKDLLRLKSYQAIHTLEDIQEDNMTEDAQQQSLWQFASLYHITVSHYTEILCEASTMYHVSIILLLFNSKTLRILRGTRR